MSYKRTEAQRLITKFGIPEASSMLSDKENNDCVVRAIAASFEMSYDEAHVVAKTTFGRKLRLRSKELYVYNLHFYNRFF